MSRRVSRPRKSPKRPSIAFRVARRLPGAPSARVRRRSSAEYLFPLKKKSGSRLIVTYDVESKKGPSQAPGYTRPFLIGFYDGETYRSFRNDERLGGKPGDADQHLKKGGCIDKFCNWLFRSEEGLKFTEDTATLYGHFSGGFDVLFIISWLHRQRDLRFRVVPTMNKVQALIVVPVEPVKKNQAWCFLDAAGLLSSALDKLAKSYGVENKIKLPLETDESDPQWEKYNERDNVALYGVLTRFRGVVEDVLGGEVKISSASTSLATFRRSFMQKPIKRNVHEPGCKDRNCVGCLHQWVRQAYYGGRTEVLIHRGRRLRYYDINAAYGYACTHPMPVGDVVVLRTPQEHERWMSTYLDTRVGFIDATVEIPADCEIPPLPRRKGRKLVFETGRFRGIWDAEELRLLYHPMVKGKVVRVHKSVWYQAKPVFEPYMRKLYALRVQEKEINRRIEANEATAEDLELLPAARAQSDAGKNLTVRFYGKWATNPDRTEFLHMAPGERPPIGAVPIGCTDGDDFNSSVWVRPYRFDAAYIIPQIAAHIASLARVALFFVTVEVRKRGGKVFYLGTDAIACNVDLPETLDLGGLRRDDPGLLFSGNFLRPMDYSLAGRREGADDKSRPSLVKHKVKGVPLRLANEGELTIERLDGRERLARGEGDAFKALQGGHTVKFDRLEQIRSLMRRMAKPGENPTPEMKTMRRTIRGEGDKRERLVDGSTRPWNVVEYGEDEETTDGAPE